MTIKNWTIGIIGFTVFLVGIAAAMALHLNEALSPWLGSTVATIACIGLATLVYQVAVGMFREDSEGVERQHAGTAAFVALVTLMVGGFSYSLLEAFADLPRLTAAVPAVAVACVWMFTWAALMHRDSARE